jgi:hypothetical protein
MYCRTVCLLYAFCSRLRLLLPLLLLLLWWKECSDCHQRLSHHEPGLHL